jgi:aldose 1-epimerase
VAVAYTLSDAGLTVSTSVENVGGSACPFGCGQHPYLSPGTGLVDDCMLEVPARTRVVTDDERQLPTGLEPVDGTRFDFRVLRRIGDERIDFAFTDLIRDGGGRAVVRLDSAELWVDEHYRYVEIYTGDTLAPGRRRHGLGVEPMTCAPNGFASGEGLLRLEPGESITTRWGARLA